MSLLATAGAYVVANSPGDTSGTVSDLITWVPGETITGVTRSIAGVLLLTWLLWLLFQAAVPGRSAGQKLRQVKPWIYGLLIVLLLVLYSPSTAVGLANSTFEFLVNLWNGIVPESWKVSK